MQENQQVILQIHYPPVIGYSELAELLGKTAATLQADMCRAPDRLPPPCLPPGTNRPRWLLADVISWLAAHRRGSAPEGGGVPPTAPPRRRGRPTKAEEIARRGSAPEGGGVPPTAAAQQQTAKARRVRKSGIITWTQDDVAVAEQLEASADAADIAQAVANLRSDGKEAVPGLVMREIERLRARARAEEEVARRKAEATPPLDAAAQARGMALLPPTLRAKVQAQAEKRGCAC